MLIGKHQHRYWYFLGRFLSYALAGGVAGGAGALINLILKEYQLAALTSLLFGSFILLIGCFGIFGLKFSLVSKIAVFKKFSQRLSGLLLQDKPSASFWFGFFTVTLPCGQTLVVFSACALTGDFGIGFFNGGLFALLTSPSLFFSMKAYQWGRFLKSYADQSLHYLAIFVGLLAICRGLAELEWIPHLVLNERYHLVVF